MTLTTFPSTENQLLLAERVGTRYGILRRVDLGSDLAVRQDRSDHAIVEPSRRLTLQQFQDALAHTRLSWKLFCR